MTKFQNCNCVLKDTLAISKSAKKSLGFTKLRSQNSEIRFPVIRYVIRKYYVIFSIQKKMLISGSLKIMTLIFWFEWICNHLSSLLMPKKGIMSWNCIARIDNIILSNFSEKSSQKYFMGFRQSGWKNFNRMANFLTSDSLEIFYYKS